MLAWPRDTKIEVRAPLVQGRKGEFRELFETVRKQGFIRAYVDGELIEVADPPKLNRRQNHTISVVVDRLVVRADDRGRLTDSIETALKLADGVVEVAQRRRGNDRDLLRALRLPELRHLAARARAAPLLLQLAVRRVPDLRWTRHASSRERTAHPRQTRRSRFSRAWCLPWGEPSGYLRKIVLPALARQLKFDLNTPWGDLPEERARRDPPRREARSGKQEGSGDVEWEGVLRNVERRYDESESDSVRMELQEFMIEVPCSDCGGRRLKREALSVTVQGRSIGDIVELPVTDTLSFFESRSRSQERQARARRRDRRPDPQGSARASALPRRRRTRLPHARPRGRIAVGRRSAAHSAGDADRIAPRRRAVHPRRAVDRTASARQRATARARSSSFAISATRSSSSSTTRRRCAPPIT